MKRLIVNADDYGHTPGIAEGIRKAHLQGTVTSTSAMMSRPGTPAELNTAAELCPNLGIGVHLVLTTGKSILPAEKVSSLVNPEGFFYKLDPFVQHISQLKLEEVWLEWNAQVEAFVKCTGHIPDHLDSHHHSSYFTPALFERMLRLAEELHCPIRKPFGDDSADPTDYLPEELAAQTREDYQHLTTRRILPTTDGFIGDFYDEGATTDNLIQIIEQLNADPVKETFELMCHPAIVDDALMAVTSYNLPRGRELEILTSDQVKMMLLKHNIKLINYSELADISPVE